MEGLVDEDDVVAEAADAVLGHVEILPSSEKPEEPARHVDDDGLDDTRRRY